MTEGARTTEQLIVYLDLLGTREAIRDARQSIELLDLQLVMSSLNSTYDVQVEEGESKNTAGQPTPWRRIQMRPEVSTFSDLVVMSMPMRPDRTNVEVYSISNAVSTLVALALDKGFLVRGGATIGQLYHQDRVVFGEAMVEAYLIESQSSIYPRIVVSPALVSRTKDFGSPIVKDDDGLYCLDYFPALLIAGALSFEVKGWFDRAIGTIESNLTRLRDERALNAFAKWSWFHRKWLAALTHENVRGWGLTENDLLRLQQIDRR
jgi:hypothetical protein